MHVTTTMTASHLWHCASLVLNINKDDPSLKLWSTHSIQVMVANLLHRANISHSYIQTHLRWKSLQLLVYLCSPIYTDDAHAKAVNTNIGAKEQSKASYCIIP